jgi:dTDP-4-dehydrorhamnose reductase
MRILVIGAAGQVALSLVEASEEQRFCLVALGRPDVDLTLEADVVRVVADTKPDVVINAAAYTAVDQAEKEPDAAHLLNATGPAWLAREALKLGAPILHLSTDYVFDGSKTAPYLETDATRPLGVYGASKLAGERAVAESNPMHLIVRTAWVYSPFGKNFVKTMLRLAADRDEVGVVADQRGNPTYAPDIAHGLLVMARTAVSMPKPVHWGIFNMTAPDDGVWADFAESIFAESAALGGPSATVRRLATADYPTPVRRPSNSRLDGSKLNRIYGIRLPSWRTSLARCVGRLIATQGT